jgi:imidazolonepropionase-like amidohydrolase
MKRAVLATATAFLCTPASADAQDLFLANAKIVDPAAEEVRVGNLLILDGRIAGSPDRAPAELAGETIDLEGKWVIPGLIDLHTHSYGNQAPGNVFEGPGTAVIANRMLYAGVTAFLDLFGLESAMYALRERQRAGEVGGADLYTSLSCLTATEGHCTEYGIPTRVMDSPEDARRVVADLATRRPDVVKIVYSPTGRMPSIDRETLAAAIATATENGIQTVIHINTWDDVRDAVELGASAVTHVPFSGVIPADLARLMARRGVSSIPTLAVETDFQPFVADASVLDNPLARALASEQIIGAYRTEETRAHADEMAAEAEQRRASILGSVKAMADAGVNVLAGTDAGNWGTIQGFSVHRELAIMVEAGLTEWQALAAATTRAGKFLGRAVGVSAGSVASLVVLDASPIAEITNTQGIEMVIHHGRMVDREMLLGNGS